MNNAALFTAGFRASTTSLPKPQVHSLTASFVQSMNNIHPDWIFLQLHIKAIAIVLSNTGCLNDLYLLGLELWAHSSCLCGFCGINFSFIWFPSLLSIMSTKLAASCCACVSSLSYCTDISLSIYYIFLIWNSWDQLKQMSVIDSLN